jgi:ethanolamine permease
MGHAFSKPELRVLPGSKAGPRHENDIIDMGPRPSVTVNGKKFSYARNAMATGATKVEMHRQKYAPTKWDLWMLGITVVIGGQYFSWNAGLEAGLYSYFLALLLISSGYITLCCCTSEITGALPFAGGAYGLSRCTLGFYAGFMIGCCEALEYIAYVASSVVALAMMIVEAVPALEGLEPVIHLLFYVSALFFHIRGDRTFWLFNLAIGSISLLIVFLFLFGSIPYANFQRYARDPEFEFVGGMAKFLKVLPLGAWFFVGVEALSLASDQVAQPKVMVPFAQVTCVLTLFVTGIAVFFTTVSLPPGITHIADDLVPFNLCFTQLFGIGHHAATVFSLPATYATAFGFMWCYGKLIAAMASSRLLPPILGRATNTCGTPYVGITFGSLLSFLLCLLVHFVPRINRYLFITCITCAFMSYMGQCIGYISLKLSYRNIKSSAFHNPFGIPGAIYSMCVWILGLVGIAGFQDDGGVEILTFLGLVGVLSIYYYVYAKKRQTFSAQENRILLVAHVMKFNGKRTAAVRRARRGNSPQRTGNMSTTGGTHNSQFSTVDGTSTKRTTRVFTRVLGGKQSHAT